VGKVKDSSKIAIERRRQMANQLRPDLPDQQETPITDGDSTEIWDCTSQACKGWMRKSQSFADSPDCPICDSPMEDTVRILPKLQKVIRTKGINFGRTYKQ
jgi:phospholipid N-methyltransferase